MNTAAVRTIAADAPLTHARSRPTRTRTLTGHELSLELGGREVRLSSRPGVFSAGAVDEGTLLLLRAVLPDIRPHQTLLDLGTGAGVIGVALAPLLTRGEVWMVDVDIRAVRLATQNVEAAGISNAHVVLGDGTGDLPRGLRFDMVLSNPPTHDGRDVLQQFVQDSHRVLRPGGSFWCVVNRLLSLKAMMTAEFENVEVAARRKGYLLVRSEKSRR
jgi:16S rRNA (guanine1207-N2)-methyltransferase